MIHADKNYLKAKLEKGYFELQFQLYGPPLQSYYDMMVDLIIPWNTNPNTFLVLSVFYAWILPL